MPTTLSRNTAECIAPYFDDLLARLEKGDASVRTAFGRHVHWGFWPEPERADGTAQDYAIAAERLCQLVCDAAAITDGNRILDVGCGFGGTIASLNERFHNLDMIGVNIDARQLDRAARTVIPQNGNRIRFVRGDACALDVPPASFDVVLAVECIFHFGSRADFFRGAGRALRPGGHLALSDFVPPREAVATLAAHDPAKDEATRITYGQINVSCSAEEYARLADQAGMTLGTSRDVTDGTMPTYVFLQSDLRTRPDRQTARVHARATSRIEIACRAGLLKYTILSFTRRS